MFVPVDACLFHHVARIGVQINRRETVKCVPSQKFKGYLYSLLVGILVKPKKAVSVGCVTQSDCGKSVAKLSQEWMRFGLAWQL